MMRTLFIAVLGTLSPTTQAPEADALVNRLVGSWRLISSEGISTDGTVTRDQGPEPLGRLILDDAGRMSVHLVNPTPKTFRISGFPAPYA